MSLNMFNPDQTMIDQIGSISIFDEQGQLQLMKLSIDILEGKDISDEATTLSEAMSTNASKIGKLCSAIAALLWECAKHASKNHHAEYIQDRLTLGGVTEGVAANFCKTFQDNRKRLLALKGSFGVSVYSYHNLAWRLEVELSKRSLHVTSNPRYLLRLDLVNNTCAAATEVDSRLLDTDTTFKSIHLQADHANMKRLECELQRAVDEANTVHCQRINRYLS